MRVVYGDRPKWRYCGTEMLLPFSLTEYMRFSVWLFFFSPIPFSLACPLAQFSCSFLASVAREPLLNALYISSSFSNIYFHLVRTFSSTYVCVCEFESVMLPTIFTAVPFLLLPSCRCIFVRFVREYNSITYYFLCVVHCSFFRYFFFSFFWLILI